MNTNLPSNSGSSLDGFEFTFESYLDGSSRIEADVSCEFSNA